MKQVEINTEFKINNPDQFIDVEVVYRCWFSDHQAMYPMTISGEICEEESLQDFIKWGKEDYEKTYKKVDVVKVFVGE